MVMKLTMLAVLFLAFIIILISTAGYRDALFDDTGLTLFTALVFIELIAMAILTPPVTAGIVCGERNAKTLGLLLITRLRPLNIVQDKGLSRILFMVFLCVVTLPFMFAGLLFGGVESAQIIAGMGNVLAVIFISGGFSLLSSTVSRKFGTALALTYTALFLYMVVLPVVTIMLTYMSGFTSEPWFISCFNPYLSTGICMDSHALSNEPLLIYSWISNLAMGILLYFFCVMRAAQVLNHDDLLKHRTGKPQGKREKIRAFLRSFPRWHMASICHHNKLRGYNIMAWRESNLIHNSMKAALYRISDLLMGIYLLILLLSCSVEDNVLEYDILHLVGHAFAFPILIIFTIIMAASSFTKDRETGSLDVLLTTRLKGSHFIGGAFRGLLRSICPFLFTLFLILLIGRIFSSDIRMVLPMVNALVYFSFVIVLGMYMSLKKKSSIKAIGWTLGIVLVIAVGIPILAVIADEIHWYDASEVILGISPSKWVIEGPSSDANFFVSDWYFSWHLVVTATYAMVTGILLALMSRRFDKYVGRQPSG